MLNILFENYRVMWKVKYVCSFVLLWIRNLFLETNYECESTPDSLEVFRDRNWVLDYVFLKEPSHMYVLRKH